MTKEQLLDQLQKLTPDILQTPEHPLLKQLKEKAQATGMDEKGFQALLGQTVALKDKMPDLPVVAKDDFSGFDLEDQIANTRKIDQPSIVQKVEPTKVEPIAEIAVPETDLSGFDLEDQITDSTDQTSESGFDVDDIKLPDLPEVLDINDIPTPTLNEPSTPSSSNSSMASIFTEEKVISQGGMGTILVGLMQGKRYIVKRIKEKHKDDEKYKKLFYREYENAKDLNHEHIVRVHHYGEDEKGAYYYMDYVDGRTLGEMIGKEGLEDEQMIERVLREICQALDYVHKKQVVHRDLKPDNILLTYKGDHVKIIDFGLASADQFEDQLKKAGTEKYAAPEQLSNAKSVDNRADLYSLGLILVEMLTGQLKPKKLEGTKEKYNEIQQKCLQPDPKFRFSNAQEIIRYLDSKKGSQSDSERIKMELEIERLKTERKRLEIEQQKIGPQTTYKERPAFKNTIKQGGEASSPVRRSNRTSSPSYGKRRKSSGKNKFIAAALAFFLGSFGAHFFYLGDNKRKFGFLFLVIRIAAWLTGIGMLAGLLSVVGVIFAIRFVIMKNNELDEYIESPNIW